MATTPTITAAGISAPTYNDIYQYLIGRFQAIYGEDIYIEPDSQDGQWIAELALAIYNSNAVAVDVFNSFSPAYSQGAQLSALVQLNGIARKVPTRSTAVGQVGGVIGTVITGGVVADTGGNLWDLPASVTIGGSGLETVTVTAQTDGNLTAPIGTITRIYNPQLGWQTFTNTVAAVAGDPVETDAELRQRRAQSVATPSQSIKAGIYAAVANISGVQRLMVYENDTNATDGDGIPAHSICVVAEGGDSTEIATAINNRKSPGVQTYGGTTVSVTDRYGLVTEINFDSLAPTDVYFDITIKALPGYVSTIGDAMKTALADFVNALDIGEDVYVSQASAATSLSGTANGQTFYISDFKLGTSPSPVGTGNIAIAFNAAAICDTANIDITVT